MVAVLNNSNAAAQRSNQAQIRQNKRTERPAEATTIEQAHEDAAQTRLDEQARVILQIDTGNKSDKLVVARFEDQAAEAGAEGRVTLATTAAEPAEITTADKLVGVLCPALLTLTGPETFGVAYYNYVISNPDKGIRQCFSTVKRSYSFTNAIKASAAEVIFHRLAKYTVLEDALKASKRLVKPYFDEDTFMHGLTSKLGATAAVVSIELSIMPALINVQYPMLDPTKPHITGVVQSAKDVYQRGGLRGFYTGSTQLGARTALFTAAQYAGMEGAKSAMDTVAPHFKKDHPTLHRTAYVATGIVTGTFMSSLAQVPMTMAVNMGVGPGEFFRTTPLAQIGRTVLRTTVSKSLASKLPGIGMIMMMKDPCAQAFAEFRTRYLRS